MTTHIINISQKYVKTPIREEQLFVWTEDLKIEEIDPSKRMELAMENLKFLKSKAWSKIRGGSLDEIKVFDEDDYEELMKKEQMKENN